MMRKWLLLQDESLLWQGRPAPRCYVFRQFPVISVTTTLMLAAMTVLWRGDVRAGSGLWWLLVAVTTGCALAGPLTLLWRRWHWEYLYYAVTDRRILVQKRYGNALLERPLENLRKYGVHRYTAHLARIKLEFRADSPIVFECLEDANSCLAVLERGPAGDASSFPTKENRHLA